MCPVIFQEADCLKAQRRCVCIRHFLILSHTTFFWTHYYCLHLISLLQENKKITAGFCSVPLLDWLPEFKPGCDWSIPRTRLGWERQKQIRAGASPNKVEQSVSIPHVARYPPTTHRDIPLLSQKKHKYTFTAFVLQQEFKFNMVMCELCEFPTVWVAETC